MRMLFCHPDSACGCVKATGKFEGVKLVAAAGREFLKAAEGTIAIERHAGLAAARDVFLTMLSGQIDPAKGIVIEP